MVRDTKVLHGVEYTDDHYVAVEYQHCDRLVAKSLPCFAVLLPRPWQVIALVAFNHLELEVIEEPKD